MAWPIIRPDFSGANLEDSPHDHEIANDLFVSQGTVRNHLSGAIQKPNVQNRIEVARAADEKGWLQWYVMDGLPH